MKCWYWSRVVNEMYHTIQTVRSQNVWLCAIHEAGGWSGIKSATTIAVGQGRFDAARIRGVVLEREETLERVVALALDV